MLPLVSLVAFELAIVTGTIASIANCRYLIYSVVDFGFFAMYYTDQCEICRGEETVDWSTRTANIALIGAEV